MKRKSAQPAAEPLKNKGGRPLATDVARSKVMMLRLTPDEHAKITLMGGSSWVREQVLRLIDR